MWCPRTESNRGPIDYKSIALPAELQGHNCFVLRNHKLIKSFLNNLNDDFKKNELVAEVINFLEKDKKRPICTPFSK